MRMSAALPVVFRLGPGKHSLASILLGQRQDDLSCDGRWGCRVSIPVLGGDQLGQCYPHLSLDLTVMTRALAGPGD